jgi:23S rRNA (cytosine1962-C5)-methyltransferase
MNPSRVVIQPRRSRPFFARHPWVFTGSIGQIEGQPACGEEVRVVSAEGQFIARGLINPAGNLRVRLYRWQDAPLDESFWSSALELALGLRRDLRTGDPEAGAQRLVSSEGDGLSGLTVDRYGPWLIAQFTSRALWEWRNVLAGLLQDRVVPRGMRLRFDSTQAARENTAVPPDEVRGACPEGPVEIVENGLTFEVDLAEGQKTGFYLDQSANRRRAGTFAQGRSALDLFCYTGGFALNLAAHGPAREVLGIDSSAPAIERARRNARRNGLDPVEFQAADVFRSLETLRAAGRRFGLIVCDPPRFARSQRDVEAALNGYLRLNRAALELLEPGGILVTCSCSGFVDRASFLAVLSEVATLSQRTIRILESRGQPADHPVSVSCPETEYLKCLIARVD